MSEPSSSEDANHQIDGGEETVNEPPTKQMKLDPIDGCEVSVDEPPTKQMKSDPIDGGEESADEPPTKQMKSDQCPELPMIEASSESEPPATGVGFDDLPDEIIVKILFYSTFEELMDITQNVCTRWQRLSHDSSLWRDKQFTINWACSDDDAVTLLQQMPQLRTLLVQRVVDSSVIEALSDTCSRLTTLQVDASQQMRFPLLKRLVQNCENIQSLSISHHILRRRRKARTLALLRQLKSLDVSADTKTNTLIHLRPFADGCPDLTRVNLSKKVNISLEDVEYFFKLKCKTLTHVTLPWLSYCGRCVVPLLAECTSLVYLQLDDCRVMNEEATQAFSVLGRLSNLRSLILNELWGCPTAAAALAFKSGGLSRLQVLNMTENNLEGNVVEAVCRQCPELRELYLRGWRILTDEGLGQLYRLTKLETLDLSQCWTLRGGAMQCVAQLPKLRKLHLMGLSARNLQPSLERVLDITSLEILSLDCMLDYRFFPIEKIPGKLVNLKILKLRGVVVQGSLLERLHAELPDLQVRICKAI